MLFVVGGQNIHIHWRKEKRESHSMKLQVHWCPMSPRTSCNTTFMYLEYTDSSSHEGAVQLHQPACGLHFLQGCGGNRGVWKTEISSIYKREVIFPKFHGSSMAKQAHFHFYYSPFAIVCKTEGLRGISGSFKWENKSYKPAFPPHRVLLRATKLLVRTNQTGSQPVHLFYLHVWTLALLPSASSGMESALHSQHRACPQKRTSFHSTLSHSP
uniref:uncharacterized protein LOC132686957 n=1 Tax=Panthera onca TaxID=9690 RepID=UPI002952F059|nr:uncharacterized protein LOC132686957 [Panthera onca]